MGADRCVVGWVGCVAGGCCGRVASRVRSLHLACSRERGMRGLGWRGYCGCRRVVGRGGVRAGAAGLAAGCDDQAGRRAWFQYSLVFSRGGYCFMMLFRLLVGGPVMPR